MTKLNSTRSNDKRVIRRALAHSIDAATLINALHKFEVLAEINNDSHGEVITESVFQLSLAIDLLHKFQDIVESRNHSIHSRPLKTSQSATPDSLQGTD